MIRARSLAAAAVALVIVSAAHAARAADGPLETAAYGWLALLDSGRFDDAWSAGDPLLREGVSRDAWTQATRKLRDGFGPIAGRRVVAKDYHQQIEGGPDGTYFTLRIATRFAGGGELVEVVTLTAGADPVYRPVAYGVKR